MISKRYIHFYVFLLDSLYNFFDFFFIALFATICLFKSLNRKYVLVRTRQAITFLGKVLLVFWQTMSVNLSNIFVSFLKKLP